MADESPRRTRAGRSATVRQSAGPAAAQALEQADAAAPECPKCSGRMWDNRLSKRNPRAPDFKCRDRGCDGVIWPARPDRTAADSGSPGSAIDDPGTLHHDAGPLVEVHEPGAATVEASGDDLPF